MNRFLTIVSLLLLGLWLGAAIFFGAAVAPNLFAVLRDAGLGNANELAGSVITRLLRIVNRSGFEISLFIIVTRYFTGRHERLRWRLGEMISLAIVAMMTAVSQWIISPKMLALRAAMGVTIDQASQNDARRMAFDNLHRYSVDVMGVALIAALMAFVMIAIASIRSPTAEGSTGH
jgi:hypothetical protein